MNKKFFAGLVVLMGISILGIIAVQLIWINNALKVKNELFSQGVTEAMNNSVKKLEHLNDFTVFNQIIFNDTLHWLSEGKIPPPPPPPAITMKSGKHPGSKAIAWSSSGHGGTRIQVFTGKEESGKHVYTDDSITTHVRVIPGSGTRNQERKIIVVRNDSVVGTLDSIYSSGMVRIDSLITRFDTVTHYVPDLRKRIAVKAGRLKQVANQVVTEINTWDVKTVDFSLVGKILEEEFNDNRIPIMFEYGIFRDSLLTDHSAGADSTRLVKTAYKADLYPNDIFQKNLQLSVYFPGKENFILRSMNWLLAASLLFSFIILATFTLSIFFILRQKKISEMKSDFINNMTHEFKTPIATISVAIDSINNDRVIADQEKVRYFAGMIKKENTRMNRQVEDILTIARLDRKDFEFRWEPCNVHDLTEGAIQSIILQVEKRGGRITQALAAVNPVVTTDKNHFTNLIYNLLDNANKYSAEKPDITVFTRNIAKGIIISVEDKGIGMTKSVQSKIFERFYRQSSGNIHNVKGFGLGLSYVKAVTEANHGTISVQSEAGKGSRFDVFLPFLRE